MDRPDLEAIRERRERGIALRGDFTAVDAYITDLEQRLREYEVLCGTDFTPGKQLIYEVDYVKGLERAEKVVGMVRMARDELGAVQPEYPAPVAVCAETLDAALAEWEGEP